MRKSGVLLPISFLPSPQAKGSLGSDAHRFVDFLHTAGQSLWQTDLSFSAASSFCVFAKPVDRIDLTLLCEEGLLSAQELEIACSEKAVFSKKAHFWALSKAVARQNKASAEYLQFKEEQASWLSDYALFMAIRETQTSRTLSEWPEALRRRNSYALKAAQTRLAPRLEYWSCVQFFHHRQWQALKKHANRKGIQLVGSLSFFAASDSADAWVHPELFQQSADKSLFYDWPQHKRSRFEWWLRRLEFASQQFDIIRMPYFEGFAGDWLAENSEWKAGPGTDFVRILHRTLPKLKLITEDGTALAEEASALLAYSGYPGSKTLCDGFFAKKDKTALPHRHTQHMVLYTSLSAKESLTHWQNEADASELAKARHYFCIKSNATLRKAMLHAAQASVAQTVLVPLWDWLCVQEASEQGFSLRRTDLNHWLAAEMRELCALYEREAPQERVTKPKPRRSKLFKKKKGKEYV